MMMCSDGLDFHREKKTVFLVLGFLHGVHDVLETAVKMRNVAGKSTSHNLQKTHSRKTKCNVEDANRRH